MKLMDFSGFLKALCPPPQPPSSFFHIIKSKKISIHPSIIQPINVVVCLALFRPSRFSLFLARKRHGGEALRPPPNPPQAFFLHHITVSYLYRLSLPPQPPSSFFDIIIKKTLHPSVIQPINVFVCLALFRPSRLYLFLAI